MAKGGSISEALRRAIVECGLSHNAIAKATGVQRASIDRFVNGERTLRLDKADALAAYFNLETRPKPKGR
jgi:plasmid maintenance system antidote protein VapI